MLRDQGDANFHAGLQKHIIPAALLAPNTFPSASADFKIMYQITTIMYHVPSSAQSFIIIHSIVVEIF